MLIKKKRRNEPVEGESHQLRFSPQAVAGSADAGTEKKKNGPYEGKSSTCRCKAYQKRKKREPDIIQKGGKPNGLSMFDLVDRSLR